MPATVVHPADPYGDLLDLLGSGASDPSRLVFHDELTDLRNRRFLKGYFERRVRWRTGEDFPLSLLVLDLDHFKAVNDAHGHETGDRALSWVADLLREVAGSCGIPIRYAGDEFAVVLPGADRAAGLAVAERLVTASAERPLGLGPGATLPLTLSVGVATAPDDAADGDGLFQAADSALYHAKRTGRNRAAEARTVDPERIFPLAALHQLRQAGLAGRDEDLLAISRALDGLRRGRGGFLVFEGGTGMGKTALLSVVAERLAGDAAVRVTRAEGDPREEFQPYALARALLETLVRGAGPGESATAAKLLERLAPLAGDGDGREPAAVRSGIHAGLREAFHGIGGPRPLVLLVDDLQSADEATLRLLSELAGETDPPALVIACALDPPGPDSPLPRFYEAAPTERPLRRARLESLSGEEVGLHLQRLFPGLRAPLGFADEIVRATGGNPLFVSEVVRELIADGKVTLRDSRWTADRLPPGYLPASLDEILRRRIGSLAPDDKALLDRVAALGEEAPLSLLVGSAEEDEGRVLDFADRAEALGLVRVELEDDREVVRFLGKRVQEVSYETIDLERRARLHEELGTYGETLVERGAASPALPAWQFRRAGDEARARPYLDLRREQALRLFDPADALDSVATLVEADVETEAPLADGSLPLVAPLVRAFTKAVRDVQLYPAESRAVAASRAALLGAVEAILADNERLHLSHGRRALLVNGRRVHLPEVASQSTTFVDLLAEAELQGVLFLPGLEEREVRALVEEMGGQRQGVIPPGHWREVVRERGLEKVRPEQVRYTQVIRRRVAGEAASPVIEDEELDAGERRRVPRILRALQAAVRAARLYAPEAPAAAVPVTRLHEALRAVLVSGKAVTLAEIDGIVLVNGRRVDGGETGDVVTEIAGTMSEAGLESVSFLPEAPRGEIEAFVRAVVDASDGEPETWTGLASRLGLERVVPNARRYATPVVSAVLGVPDVAGEPVRRLDPVSEEAERLGVESETALLETLPEVGRQMLSRGRPDTLRRLLERALEGYADRDPMTREMAIRSCESLLASLEIGDRHEFATLAADPLLEVLASEAEPRVLEGLGQLLQEIAGAAIQLGDGDLAVRVLEAVRERRERLAAASGERTRARLLDRPLEPRLRDLLVQSLRSGDAEERSETARILANLGESRIPLLLDLVREEPGPRTRLLAAGLVAEAGPAAVWEYRRALATETSVTGRARLLDVADTVTADLREELAAALTHAEPEIREAGLRLFDRLRRDDLVDLLMPLIGGPDPEAARGAIGCLAALGSPKAVETLRALRRSTRDPAILTACCQALGEIGDPEDVPALADVLGRRRFGLFGRRWDESVRAAAAAVLSRMDDPAARRALSRFAGDPHPAVREIARGASREEQPVQNA